MNKYYFLLLFTTISFSQYKADTLRQEKDVLKPLVNDSVGKVFNDTIKIKNLSNTPEIIPVSDNKETRVVIVKDESKADYARYLLPIFTLLLGIFINRFIDYYNDKKRIIKSGERWTIELRSLEQPIKSQIKILDTFIFDLDNIQLEKTQLGIITTIDGSVFKSLDKNEFLKYIKLKNKTLFYKFPLLSKKESEKKEDTEAIRISNLTQNFISVLTNQSELVKQMWEVYQKGIDKYGLDLRNNSKKLDRQIFLIARELEKPEINTESRIFRDNSSFKPIIGFYMKKVKMLYNKDFNATSIENEFLKPLIKMSLVFKNNELFNDLAIIAGEVSNDINEIKAEINWLKENSKFNIIRYRKILENLNTVLNEIDGIKSK